MKKAHGFTLLEMVIAVTILATLTVLSTQSIQQAMKAKAKLQEQVDDMSLVRDSLRVIERDVNLAFHYQDLQVEFDAEVFKQKKPVAPPLPPGMPPPPDDMLVYMNDPQTKNRYKNRKNPATQFVGKVDGMDFATSNVGRISQDQPMADFAKVGYALRGCKKLGVDKTSGQCLVRRFSPFAEGDITQGGQETVLLENVSEFKLRYFGAGKQDWNEGWDSTANDAATKDSYPQAVEISLAVEMGKNENVKKKKISMQLIVPIRFPNNKDKPLLPGSAGAPGL